MAERKSCENIGKPSLAKSQIDILDPRVNMKKALAEAIMIVLSLSLTSQSVAENPKMFLSYNLLLIAINMTVSSPLNSGGSIKVCIPTPTSSIVERSRGSFWLSRFEWQAKSASFSVR